MGCDGGKDCFFRDEAAESLSGGGRRGRFCAMRSLPRLLVLSFAFSLLSPLWGRDTVVLPLWDGAPPNSKEASAAERGWTDGVLRVEKVQAPTIEVRLPSTRLATGQAVVVCPGGGYRYLSYEWEGTEIANWLNAHGIAALVLKYRLPDAESSVEPKLSPLLDAQRAVRLARFHAAEWNINSNKVGVMGFSAGGHLASTLGTRFDLGDSAAADPVERLSCRPDFLALVYPVVTMREGVTHAGSRGLLLGEEPSTADVERYSNELQVTADTPPTFLVHAGDDKSVPVANSIGFYEALVAAGVPAEMHLYPYGGHGFGLALGRGRLADWGDLCLAWMGGLEVK